MSKQRGSSDCGLFAISFAATLAAGKHPSAFLFYQRKMREHLHTFLIMSGPCFRQLEVKDERTNLELRL